MASTRNIALAMLFLVTLLVAPFAIGTQLGFGANGDPADWYKNVEGVLDSEREITDRETGWDEGLGVLYPYENDVSLDVGFSKYGELIDPYNEKGVRLRRDDTTLRDMFVRAPEDIPPTIWLNGWLIEVAYKTNLKTPNDRFVWAFALFADGSVWGGDWVTVEGSDGGGLPEDEDPIPGSGGRQTNTYCKTEDIEWLFIGPRRSVAYLVTHVYDANINPETGEILSKWALVDICLTLIFNKDKKYVIILKDIKYKYPEKPWPPLDIKFSNREQVDLGPAPEYGSYAHFWHQDFSTCYGGNWLDTDWILKEVHEERVVTGGAYSPGELMLLECVEDTELPAIKASTKVYVGGVLQKEGVDYDYSFDETSTDCMDNTLEATLGEDYWREKAYTHIKWMKTIPINAVIRIEYKNIVKELKYPEPMPAPFDDQLIWVETGESHRYDLAQFISADAKYVGFKAYWPTTSSYALDAFDEAFETIHFPPVDPAVTPHWSDELDMVDEPKIPFNIGQWDFMLDKEEKQFRAVEVLGMVEYHDADDANANDLNKDTAKENQVDSEVYWQLQEVFNPWDLNDAVYKKTRRLVEYFVGDGEEDEFYLQEIPWHDDGWRDPDDYKFDGADTTTTADIDPDGPGVNDPYEYWWMYCTFAEKVLVDGVLQFPEEHYTIEKDAVTGQIYIDFDEAPDEGALVKVLYSVYGGTDPFSDPSLWDVDWRGNYEWIIVGRDATSKAALGAALVTEFFKDKQVPVLWSGLDMKDEETGPNVPYVLVKQRPRLGDSWDAYKKEAEDGVPCHGRATLRDDWCHTVPVKSSDMIGVGGPVTSHFTKYWNDFTNAYWDPADGQIETLTCWSKNTYSSGIGDDLGYAVISTYKDIDGTVGFLVWGQTGEDTYWACWWLWHFGWKLQEEPECVTDLVLKFDYTKLDVEPPESGPWLSAKHKPGCCFWEVIEALGTISEYDFGDTRWVWTMEWTLIVDGLEVTESFLPPADPTVYLEWNIVEYGCWLYNEEAEMWSPVKKPPAGTKYDWTSSPFWGVKPDTETVFITYDGITYVEPTSYSIDYDAGTITVTGSNPILGIKVKFEVKQPPLHPDP